MRDMLIAAALIGWLVLTVVLHRLFARNRPVGRLVVAAVAADTILTILVIGSIWRDWTR